MSGQELTSIRRYDDAITCLPKERATVGDRHHLFWPGADVNRLGLVDFRALACTSARNLDSMIHSLIHERFGGVFGLHQGGTAIDFITRAKLCVNRHDDQSCGCYNRRRLVVIDALNLEVIIKRQFDQPACTAIAIDQDIYRFMRDYYQTVAPMTDSIPAALTTRHERARCACYRLMGAERVHRPELYRQLPALRVA